jgi:polyhydroxybutyrate depolymerase
MTFTRASKAIGRYAVLAMWLMVGAGLSYADSHLEIVAVTPVSNIAVPNGTSLEDVLAQLPATTTIEVSDGGHQPVPLDWALSETVVGSRGTLEMQQVYYPTARGPYEFTGTFALPDGVSQSDPPVPLLVKMTVTVQSGPLISVSNGALFTQPGNYYSVTLAFPRPPLSPILRTFDYYVPSSYDPSSPVPLMFTLHGAGSYGAGQLFYSGFDRVAEENGFIVVAPDYGISAKGTFLTPAIAAFASAIIDHLSAAYAIDQRRIYSSGISMGGSSSQTLALGIGHRIAAIAPVASGIGSLLTGTLPRPMTVVVFYGTEDSGYPGSFYNTIDRLVAFNGTDINPVMDIWPATEDDVTSVTRFAYDGGIYDTEVVFYRVEDGGHTWPGKYQYASLLSVGLTTQHIDATELIWEHLSRHTLPLQVSVDVQPDTIIVDRPGVLPVAILSSASFDATQINPATVRLGPVEARPLRASITDADGDGIPDLMLHFNVRGLGLTVGDTSLDLTGYSRVDGAVQGSAAIETKSQGRR